MSVPIVLRPSDIPAHARGAGIRTIPLVTRSSGSTTFMNGLTIFEPGTALPLHFHNCEESVLLLEGEAIAEIEGIEYGIVVGDVTFIPAGVPHRFRNASTETGMKIMWTYASIDADRTIVATGENRHVADEHSAPVAGEIGDHQKGSPPSSPAGRPARN